MSYTWIQFKDAVDSLLLTNADREGTQTAKALKVKLGVRKIQDAVDRYREGHQDLYGYSDVVPEGFASSGTLPDDCEPRDCYMVGRIIKTVSNTVDIADNELTVTAHGLTQATALEDVEAGRFTNTGGSLPTGVATGQSYFLRVVDANTLTLHASPQNAIDNENQVDITGNGSGTTTIAFGLKRYPVVPFPWSNRHELIEAVVCMTGDRGYIAFDPNSSDFLSFPQIPVGEDDNERTWELEINWDGLKTDFDDNDATPFDDEAVDAVAEYVMSYFQRHVDKDLAAAEVSMKAHKSAKADAYLRGRRMRDTRG
jgi:hypothetical protein